MEQIINISSSEFAPLNDYLLVKVDKLDDLEKTAGGILLYAKPSVTQRPGCGIVLAAGGNCVEIKKGDYIVYPNTDGIDVKFTDSDEDNKFILLRYKSVIGKKA